MDPPLSDSLNKDSVDCWTFKAGLEDGGFKLCNCPIWPDKETIWLRLEIAVDEDARLPLEIAVDDWIRDWPARAINKAKALFVVKYGGKASSFGWNSRSLGAQDCCNGHIPLFIEVEVSASEISIDGSFDVDVIDSILSHDISEIFPLNLMMGPIWDGSVMGLMNCPWSLPPPFDVHELSKI